MKQTLEEAAKDELLHSYSNKYNGNGAFEYGQQAMLNMFFKGAEWQAKQSPWISVEEQLPGIGTPVLVVTKNGNYIKTERCKSCDYNIGTVMWKDSSTLRDSVIAWMYIPKFKF